MSTDHATSRSGAYCQFGAPTCAHAGSLRPANRKENRLRALGPRTASASNRAFAWGKESTSLPWRATFGTSHLSVMDWSATEVPSRRHEGRRYLYTKAEYYSVHMPTASVAVFFTREACIHARCCSCSVQARYGCKHCLLPCAACVLNAILPPDHALIAMSMSHCRIFALCLHSIGFAVSGPV